MRHVVVAVLSLGVTSCGGAAHLPPASPASIHVVDAVRTPLRALPPGAAIYATLRLPQLREVVASNLPDGAPKAEVEALLSLEGVDPTRPVYAAQASLDLAAPRAFFRHFQRTLVGDATAATAPPSSVNMMFRILVPLVANARPASIAAALSAKAGVVFAPCESAHCPAPPSGFAAVGTSVGQKLEAFFSTAPGVLQIDLAAPLFEQHPTTQQRTAAFTAFSAQRGGPQGGRCGALDATATTSICLDADALANVGAAAGYNSIVGALTGDGVEKAQAARIAEAGSAEVDDILKLAALGRGLTDDGTLSFFQAGNNVTGTWRMGSASLTRMKKLIPAFQCGGVSERAAMMRTMQDAFALPSSAARQTDTLLLVRNSGFAGVGILLARSWPELLQIGTLPTEAQLQRVCVRVVEDRLELRAADVFRDSRISDLWR